MASAIDYVSLPDCFGRPNCDPAPPCPSCGGLECLCRPRFFAGQLLTEDDLNRLDHYLQAKNRLHNRHLHGWGVVCGLEVICDVCEPDQRHVVVKPGYALSPCGNDIVVCRNTSIDICDLISRCRPPADDCYDLVGTPPSTSVPGTPGAAAPDNDPTLGDCGGGTEEWVLAVCYAEKPSRGVAALRQTAADCGCGCSTSGKKHGHSDCGCGGHHHGHDTHDGHGHGTSSATSSGGCGCGCGKSGRKAATPRTVPEQCEPTVVCEETRFVVYKAPSKASGQKKQYGAAARRFLCCLMPLLRDLGDASSVNNAAGAQAWATAVLDAVREFITTEGLYDCRLARRLAAIAIPAQGNDTTPVYLSKVNQAVSSIVAIAAIAWQKCFCAALLPPCPDPSQTDCVPLATITVSRSTCCVLSICNLSARKFLVTIPNLQYWFSFVDLFSTSTTTPGSALRQILERLCCRPTQEYQNSVKDANYFTVAAQPGPVGAGVRVAGQPVKEPTAASTFLNALNTPNRHVGVEHILLGALGARNAAGEPFVTPEEMVNPANFLVLNQIVAPLARSIAATERAAADLTAGLAGGAGPAAGDDSARLDALAEEIAALKKTVSRQEKTIADLKKKK